jgi:hypothetical protein
VRQTLIACVLACLALAAAASAAERDRVQVGSPGRNATAGQPLSLFVAVELLPGYRPSNPFDGDARSWEGPEYRAPGLDSRPATVDWQVTFATGPVAAAVGNALAQDWPVVERPAVRVPHLVGGRRVGTIPAVAVLTEGPGTNNAQFESLVVLRLCRGVLATAAFALLSPSSVYAGGPSEPFLVAEGVPARQWNHDRALDALGRVTLEGRLPLGRLTARAAGRTVRGVARDCLGHPLAGVEARLARGGAAVARARVAADGSYRLRAPAPGSYTVSVSQLVTGKGGSGTRRETRSVSVRVR